MNQQAQRIVIAAPAKLNLGLEIAGKRDDGYHDIMTVMVTVGLFDRIELEWLPDSRATSIQGVAGVAPADNLIGKAISAFSSATGIDHGYRVAVEKHIPSPGGIGGASSDAAMTLRALNDMHESQLSPAQLHDIGTRLGSDVPFFLNGPAALATGTGTTLELLPSLNGHATLVVPPLRIAAKTASLYGSLVPGDFSDGSRAKAVAHALEAGVMPTRELLANAFERPLYQLVPDLRSMADQMVEAGAPYAALSGAGPAHYALFQDADEAERTAETLRDRFPAGTLITVFPLCPPRLDPSSSP